MPIAIAPKELMRQGLAANSWLRPNFHSVKKQTAADCGALAAFRRALLLRKRPISDLMFEMPDRSGAIQIIFTVAKIVVNDEARQI
jgi:hypothetical protein